MKYLYLCALALALAACDGPETLDAPDAAPDLTQLPRLPHPPPWGLPDAGLLDAASAPDAGSPDAALDAAMEDLMDAADMAGSAGGDL